MDKHLHIVCLDVPFPVDYGGVFDLFYKIKSLHELGIKIHLHCFEYGRGTPVELEQYCVEVLYYSRNQGHKGFSMTIPYIVASRSSDELCKNLQKDNYPIILEGIHCTYPLHCEALKERKIIVRLHNVEYQYYYNLFRTEKSLFKKAYYYNESRLLKGYEQKLANKASVLAVAEKDVQTYKRDLGVRDVSYLPAFTPYENVTSKEGIGNFCLYHGNLSVAENEKAACWLLENVFAKLKIPFVIAGKNPSARLQRLAYLNCHTCLVANPGQSEMEDLIAKAQVNILPSFNATGVKLKLLNALFNGRHCVVNDATVAESGLDVCCHIGSTAEALQQIVIQLYHLPFGEEEIRLRERTLYKEFDNSGNAKKLIASIW